ncbi:hypothetical protein ESCOCK420M_25130 [Escherichia coli]
MLQQHKVSLLLVGNQHRRLGMPQKYGLLFVNSDLFHAFIFHLDDKRFTVMLPTY